MNGIWKYATKRGEFRIVAKTDRIEVWFKDEQIGCHHSIKCALEELLSGRNNWMAFGVPRLLGVPADLMRWKFVAPRRRHSLDFQLLPDFDPAMEAPPPPIETERKPQNPWARRRV
jgi:hypothetical protein